MLPEN